MKQAKQVDAKMHSLVGKSVGISNALQIFSESKHPKNFVSLDDTDHLLTRMADAVSVAKIIAT
jgi:putative redox protein